MDYQAKMALLGSEEVQGLLVEMLEWMTEVDYTIPCVLYNRPLGGPLTYIPTKETYESLVSRFIDTMAQADPTSESYLNYNPGESEDG